jgi:hypothetical protein
MMENKIGIVVPYRNRPVELELFIKTMKSYIEQKNIPYEIIIVNQDNAKQFNRGMLLNIGFEHALKLKCDYVVFHDLDMLPLDVDYSFSPIPLHLATDFILEEGEKNREVFDEYFGGVTIFPVDVFKKINGYSNKYWGWGYEDTDLLLRCVVNEVELDTLKLNNVKRIGKTLKFNGINSLVKCKNVIDFNSNATFNISFYPDNLILNHERDSDEFTVFSVPGWDFAICYNSFARYNFCIFDHNLNALYINSKIKKNYRTNIIVTIDRFENIIKVYQDGELIGEINEFKKFYNYKKEPYFYLGVGNPNRHDSPNYFRGTIDNFAYYDIILSDEEIDEISKTTKSLNENFGKYKSSYFLKTYYDANYIDNYELVDLSENDNNGKIEYCEIVKSNNDEYVEVKVPYRRKSLFTSIKHDENGFMGNKWKDNATRWNQLRFQNEVSINHSLIERDGLSNLKYNEWGLEHQWGLQCSDNLLIVNVGI